MLRSFPIGILLALCTPTLAVAGPRVAVVGLHQEGLDLAAQQAAVEAISASVEKGDRFDALTLDELAALIRGREQIILEDAILAPGRRLLEDGRILYEQAQPMDAVPLLLESVDTLRTGMATANSSRDLWEAYMYLGTAYLATEEPELAEAAWEAAVALSPARNPNPTKFPPDVISAFDILRSEQHNHVSTLTVTADKPESTVFLNGEDRGKAPITLTNVLPGENHVVVRTRGLMAHTVVDVDPSSEEKVAIKLLPPDLGESPEARFARARQITALYRAIGERSEVELLLLVGVEGESLSLQVYSANADGFSSPVTVPFEGTADDEAATAVLEVMKKVGADGAIPVDQTVANAIAVEIGTNRLLAQLLLAPEPPKTVVAPPPPPPPPKTGRWLAVGGAGVVVLAGATTGVVLATRDTEPTDEELYQGTIVFGPVD